MLLQFRPKMTRTIIFSLIQAVGENNPLRVCVREKTNLLFFSIVDYKYEEGTVRSRLAVTEVRVIN